ncbi:MAG: hypothetical protein HY543_04335 [Deltaproteobacteria bacterium]|nr:hypothetical protein [Deltaproteobacteria bacterium]
MALTFPNIMRQTVPMGDGSFPAVVCTAADDAMIVETVTDRGQRALRLQFRSEIGGAFGGSIGWGAHKVSFFAPYAVYLTEAGTVYLRETPASLIGTTAEQDGEVVDRAVELDRLATLTGSALLCAGVARSDFALVDLAEAIADGGLSLITTGATVPAPDRMAQAEQESTPYGDGDPQGEAMDFLASITRSCGFGSWREFFACLPNDPWW